MQGTAIKNIMSASKYIYVLYHVQDEVAKPYGKGISCYEEKMYFSIPPYCHIEAKYWAMNSLEDLCISL
jgi:hypothetical protein